MSFSSTASYLDQDALYEAITENIDFIESHLNVTLGDVYRGEVDDSTSQSLSVQLIVGVTVASTAVLFVILIGLTVVKYKRWNITF